MCIRDRFCDETFDGLDPVMRQGIKSILANEIDERKFKMCIRDRIKQMINDGCNVLCVNLADRTEPSEIIDAAREKDIPIIFFNREPVEEDLMRRCV